MVVVLSSPLGAFAQEDEEVPQRTVGLVWEEGVPRVSVSVRDLVDRAVRRKLESGLPQTLTFRVLTYHDQSSEPVALFDRTCRVTYDLWEEIFRVEIAEAGRRRTLTLDGVASVLNRCLVADQLSAAGPSAVETQRRIYFGVLVELNPMSEATVRRIRRWLARPSEGEGEAFFGSFVSLFVNRELGEAERRVRFRSQWIAVPEDSP